MIESVANAEEWAQAAADRLRPYAPTIAAALGRCRQNRPCCLPICSTCARSFRAAFIAQVMALAEEQVGPRWFPPCFCATSSRGSFVPDLVREQTAVRRAKASHN